MLIASLHFGANLIIWLSILAALKFWAEQKFGNTSPFTRALCTIV